MKLLSFRKGRLCSIGVLIGKKILDLNQSLKNNFGEAFLNLSEKSFTDMISFLALGSYALNEARKVVEWATAIDQSV